MGLGPQYRFPIDVISLNTTLGSRFPDTTPTISLNNYMTSIMLTGDIYHPLSLHTLINIFVKFVLFVGLLLSLGGFLSFMVTGNVAAIRFGVILGGALLALSILSLKSYKRGRPSPLALKGQTGEIICFSLNRRHHI